MITHMDDQTGTAVRSNGPSADVQENMSRALRKTLHKLSVAIGKVMETDDPEIVHDTRVVCRRLQQRLSVFFPKPRSNKIRKLRRDLRRIRRRLGEWRNCDVLLGLVACESNAADNPEKAGAWKLVRDYLAERRSQQIRRCRRKMQKYDRPDFFAKLEKILSALPDQEQTRLRERARDAENAARQKWQAALSQAAASYAPRDLHAFRIATKRLRYRAELIRQLGDGNRSAVLDSLKTIQDLLGKWHDRQSLQVVIAEAVAQPELLIREPVLARVALQELERIQVDEEKQARDIINFACERAGLYKEEVAFPNPDDLASSDAKDLAQQSGPHDS